MLVLLTCVVFFASDSCASLFMLSQRNVGILEKIVQSMTSTQHSAETAEQYKAQVDVVAQLASRVDTQLGTAKQRTTDATAKTAIIKLERDFHKVQERVAALLESVTQMRAAQQRKAAASASLRAQEQSGGQEAMGHEEFQQLVQMQLQEDVSGCIAASPPKQTLPPTVFILIFICLCNHTQRLAEQIMREREEEIRKINQGMHQVNEIYKDLAHIVGSQQDHVDAIETQMEESRANAEAGLQQVEKANQQFGNSQCVIS